MVARELTGWGNYPRARGESIPLLGARDAAAKLRGGEHVVARGLGRSYGDSALASHVLDTTTLDHYLDFDSQSGVLTCESGVTIEALLRDFVPRGFFPPVTPGTKYVTIGGAIASDVHGKNHHGHGCFSQHVKWLDVLLGDGTVVRCSREEHADLFWATCGGMGLTGVILAAQIVMLPIPSSKIRQTTIRTKHLSETLEVFASTSDATYSMAWIDCLATGRTLGRSLVMVGEHHEGAGLQVSAKRKLSVPFHFPSFVLNPWSMRAFNALYYRRIWRNRRTDVIPYEPFFYPLDRILHWNRIYGRRGFVQHQCVVPHAAGLAGLMQVMHEITQSQRGSFLAVLKQFGEQNQAPLSFPMPGYTLALDFQVSDGLWPVLERLDRVVLDLGGRMYLTKDARMSPDTFRRGYPRWQEFSQVRAKYHGHKFASLQSQRLGIE